MRTLLLGSVLSLGLAGLGSPAAATPTDNAGVVLVDRLVVLFEAMAKAPVKIDPRSTI